MGAILWGGAQDRVDVEVTWQTHGEVMREVRGWEVGSPVEGFLYQVFVQTQFVGWWGMLSKLIA